MAGTGTTAADREDTRARLLETAGRLFAEHGYDSVTVRQICNEAGANIAAVNYHFGDKQSLYLEVVTSVLQFPQRALERVGDGPPEQQLRRFITEYLTGLLRPEGSAWALRLVQLELARPTAALAQVVDNVIRPTERGLRNIIARITGLDPQSERVRMCAHSVIGQCLHYRHAEPVFAHLWPDLWNQPERLQSVADHIASFSLHGLEGLKHERRTHKGDRKNG
ncbi:MAG TPA: CerR family C-terminal domain-containing protein [Bryobacteraceae bacterium]|nr:CerR family C-terminal domain-containing protein [Bryobacteraceae bacterium]